MADKGSSGGKKFLGQVLVEKGFVSEEDISRALKVQVGGNRRLGYVLIKMGLMSDEDLLTALSDQLDVPIVKVDDEFNPAARKILPRYLCRRYSVIPLSLEDNNVLRLGMINPLDDEAIADVENYSGHVVESILARHSDIDQAIGHHIPFSAKDFFNPQVFTTTLQLASVIIVALFIITGIYVYRDVQRGKYGTVTEGTDSTAFKNHDLMINVDHAGSIYFLGRGSYAEGHYGVRFKDADQLRTFVAVQKRNLSEDQREWIAWVLEQ